MSSFGRGLQRPVAVGAAVRMISLAGAGCGRGSDPLPAGAPSTSAGSVTGSVRGAGDFGSLQKICGPGSASGGGGRGIDATSISLGVLSDAGAAAAPGLEQEFFDAADGFSQWCNAAGGINGRKLVINKLDAKLFEGAAQVIRACQDDFMLVGGGNALDANTVKPRLGCKLGQIPAYTVSAVRVPRMPPALGSMSNG